MYIAAAQQWVTDDDFNVLDRTQLFECTRIYVEVDGEVGIPDTIIKVAVVSATELEHILTIDKVIERFPCR